MNISTDPLLQIKTKQHQVTIRTPRNQKLKVTKLKQVLWPYSSVSI